jgi:hypothetical protein
VATLKFIFCASLSPDHSHSTAEVDSIYREKFLEENEKPVANATTYAVEAVDSIKVGQIPQLHTSHY